MKYKIQQKQNQRIQQITDATIIVGADIAKQTHVARAIDFRGIELGKECVFSNNDEGLTKLVTWMKELQRLHGKTDVVFGYEFTDSTKIILLHKVLSGCPPSKRLTQVWWSVWLI